MLGHKYDVFNVSNKTIMINITDERYYESSFCIIR